MKILFLTNDLNDVGGANTLNLIGQCAQRGWASYAAAVTSLSGRSDGEVVCRAAQAPMQRYDREFNVVQAVLRQAATETVALTDFDVVFVRTNPARGEIGTFFDSALDLLQLVSERGVRVINDPAGLRLGRSKLYLLRLPENTRPRTLVSGDSAEIRAFIQGKSVLKPLQGTRGQDVFFVDSADDTNLNQIIDVLLRQGLVMVQNFLPGAAGGDTRLIVINGELLEHDGHVAAIHRVPKAGELRSNIHIGGHSIPPTITPAMRDLVAQVGPILRADGLHCVGLDVIDNQIIEVNCYSPGGLGGSSEFTGINFYELLLDRLF